VAVYLREARGELFRSTPAWTRFESQRSASVFIRDPRPREILRVLIWPAVLKQVERVVCSKLNRSNICTLHLTAHHLIFRYEDDELDEMWVSVLPPDYACAMSSELINPGWVGPVSPDISRHSASADIDREEPAHDPDEDVRESPAFIRGGRGGPGCL
jgi:hypothetical protein